MSPVQLIIFYLSSSRFQLILSSVLTCLFEATTQILRKNVDKRNLLDNLDVIYLALDEICDVGYVLSISSSKHCVK